MTTLPLPDHDPPAATPTRQAALRARFSALARQVRLRLAVEGLARAAWVLVAGLLVLALIDHRLELGLAVRLLCLLMLAAAVAHVVFHDLIRPLSLPMGPVDLAAALDRRAHAARGSELTPRIATVFELPALIDQADRPSPAMIDLAVRRGLDALGELDLRSHLDHQRLIRHSLSLATAVLLPVLLLALAGPLGGVWASRWLALSDAAWPRATTITVADVDADGRIVVPRGEPYLLRVAVADRRGPTDAVTLRLRDEAGRAQSLSLSRFAPGDFRHDFGAVQRGSTLRLTAGDAKAGPIELIPADRPRIVALRLEAKHPRDDQPSVRTFGASDGDLALLPDTDATLTFSANVPVAEARVTSAASDAPDPLRIDDRTFALRWTHRAAMSLSVELIGHEAQLASYPLPLTIGLRADRPPTATLRAEGVKTRITPTATVPLFALAGDDHAVRALWLELGRQAPGTAAVQAARAMRDAQRQRLIREAEAAGQPPPVFDDQDDAGDGGEDRPSIDFDPVMLFGPAQPATEPSIDAAHALSVGPLGMEVGEVLRIAAVAEDDRFGGPQRGTSRVLAFRITAPDELFRDILLRQQALRSRFRQSRSAAEELRDGLSVYTGSRPEAQQLLSRHRLTQRAVWQVRRSLDESATEMRLNGLGGDEAYELLRRYVLEPMGRLHDQTMTLQRQSLEALARGDDEPIDALIRRQEQTLADMDAILKAMNQWDSFIDVVNQLNEIIKVQEEVRRFTEALRQQETEALFAD